MSPPTANVKADDFVYQAAAVILQDKLKKVTKWQKAAEAGTVDGIHDMRVAVKRLREASRVFRPILPKAFNKNWLSEIEKLNDALGAVREKDVLLLSLEEMLREQAELAPLQKYCVFLAQERKKLFRKLRNGLKAIQRTHFWAKFKQNLKALGEKKANNQESVGKFAAEAISSRWQDLWEHREHISSRYHSQLFHQQRIRVKKLKYALEPFLSFLPAELSSLYKMISDLQELMGAVHDVDVQRATLWAWGHEEQNLALPEDAPEAAHAAIAKALRKTVRQHRLLLQQTRTLWAEIESAPFVAALPHLLEPFLHVQVAGGGE